MSDRLRLAGRIWAAYARTWWWLRTRSLPDAVASASSVRSVPRRHPAPSLGMAVHRCLGVGRVRPRCLSETLVLFVLLRAQGDRPAVVVGLPPGSGRRAHAWVELDGVCVGPPPGSIGSSVLARFA